MVQSMWQQYKALSPRTRMYIGLGGMAFAMAGLYVSDAMEDKLDPVKRQERNAIKATEDATALSTRNNDNASATGAASGERKL